MEWVGEMKNIRNLVRCEGAYHALFAIGKLNIILNNVDGGNILLLKREADFYSTDDGVCCGNSSQ